MTAAAPSTRFERGIDYDICEAAPVGDELALILDGWRWATLRAPPSHGVPRDVHFNEITPRILAAVARSRVKVAYDMVDETTLLGWAVIEGTTLHYVLVRRDYRFQRIARELLAGERIEFYSSKTADRFRGAPVGWKYNPWAFVPFKE